MPPTLLDRGRRAASILVDCHHGTRHLSAFDPRRSANTLFLGRREVARQRYSCQLRHHWRPALAYAGGDPADPGRPINNVSGVDTGETRISVPPEPDYLLGRSFAWGLGQVVAEETRTPHCGFEGSSVSPANKWPSALKRGSIEPMSICGRPPPYRLTRPLSTSAKNNDPVHVRHCDCMPSPLTRFVGRMAFRGQGPWLQRNTAGRQSNGINVCQIRA